ncbi:MAG: endonuclease/exonuclease/phosphatase family protein [Hormoscilla sp.]
MNAFSQVMVDDLLLWFYQKRRQQEPLENLVVEIDRLPISRKLKMQLKSLVSGNPVRYKFRKLLVPGFMLITVFTTLFSLTGYLGEFHQLFELTSHFKLQYLVISCCAFFFFLLKRKKIWVIVSLGCLLINMGAIGPWYWPQGEVSATTDIRILELNVLTFNQEGDRVISLVRESQPDIAFFLEVNKSVQIALESLQDSYPYHIISDDTAFYSKLPLLDGEIHKFDERKTFIAAKVKIKGKELQIVTADNYIPTKTKTFKLRNQQLAELGDRVAKIKTPVVVVGDLNMTMWSPYYQRFVRQTGLRNARYGFGILPTWPTFMPLLYIPLDHCLVSREIQVVNIRTGDRVGSDHLPLIIDLAIADETAIGDLI